MHTAERFFVIGRSLLLFMRTCPVTEFAVFKYGKFRYWARTHEQ